MYENFERLCEEHGVKPSDVSKATGVSASTLSNWKAGRYLPKMDKLQKIADYFGVSVSALAGKDSDKVYYFSQETAELAQELFSNPNLRVLFSAARNAQPEDLKYAADLLTRLKATNNDA